MDTFYIQKVSSVPGYQREPKSKTKCIIFSKKNKDLKDVAPVLLNGDPLPWVQQLKHLGNVLQSDNSMKVDCSVKCGKFIGKINSLMQEFSYTDPKVKIKIFNIFATSFYGSGLWDLASSEVDRIYKSWNVAVRMAFGVPPTTHRYLIEHMSGTLHPKTMLSSRYSKFVESLCKSSKMEVALLANMAVQDNRTVMGKTVSRLKHELNCQVLTSSLVRRNIKYFPQDEEWRLTFLYELLSAETNESTIDECFSSSDVRAMISSLCTS